ncbi:MAG: pyruvate dehydrogenase [Thermomicrobiales bacterium]|nr:pyruvate dehydrogenase [Thermomicrobiales bacterium]
MVSTIERPPASAQPPTDGLTPDDRATLESIERRLLWLSTLIVHHANVVRPNPDKTKVGGHQASSASVATILTALYFHYLRAGDRVSIKPHAAPAFHAAQYLLGHLDRAYLPTLREFGGLQAYPSRTKDPDKVDFSTGSVGLGAVAPVYASLAARYADAHWGAVTSDRFIALMGDAELDEGNVWETVAEEAIQGLGNVIWIIDLNRQSLDRVIPGVRAARLKALFAGAGWRVFEAKYGLRLEAAMSGPGGDALRRRIDEMSNEEYQSLIRLPDGADLRRRLAEAPDPAEREDILRSVASVPDGELAAVVSNLAGHDLPCVLDVLAKADAVTDGPSVIFAYTIKGYGLPMAGDPLNHSQLLKQKQMDLLREQFGVSEDDLWAAFPPDSPEGRWCAAAARRLDAQPTATPPLVSADAIPARLDVAQPPATSTQEALGRILVRLADIPVVGERTVTLSPDVATSTHLAGWINKVGAFAPTEAASYEESGPGLVRWKPGPGGRHIELGISEMNLFSALGQFGLSYELTGQHLLPIGTVYDPFVCRGLDALIYGLYCGAKMIFAGTPAGVSLSPEGGAHQSAVTVSLGIELPDLDFYEPAFAKEVEWIFLAAMRQLCDRDHGRSTYLRLSTKPIDQALMAEALARLGEEEIRRQALQGGYRVVDRRVIAPDLPLTDVVQIAAGGIMLPEAIAAARMLHEEGVAANVINVTSAERLYAALRAARRAQLTNARRPLDLGHLATLLPREERRAPIVTVQDAASHSLAFLGAVHGAPTVPLGVDGFGQSGSRQSLYEYAGIDPREIVNAAMLALDLAEDER